MVKRWLLVLCALPLAALAEDPNADGVHRFYAYAFDRVSGKYLYTESHEQTIEHGQWVGGQMHYWRPDGTLIGHKELSFRDDPYIPVFRTELTDPPYVEGISQAKDPIVMFRKEGSHDEQQKSIARKGPMTSDSGFHNFLRAHFDELMAGKTIEFRFVAAGRQGAYKFRARREADQQFEGRRGVQFIIEPDSLLRFMVDPLHLVYDPDTRMLLEYRGISNLRNPATGDEYDVRIDFYSKPPPEAGKLPPLS